MTTLIPNIAWCEVPAGEFIMGGGISTWNRQRQIKYTATLPYSYYAAKYPVTNAQYQAFVADNGYDKRQYWTSVGWAEKEKQQWTAARNYGEPLNLSNHPVVGVSWYEAVAYCRWLTEVLRGCGELAEGWLIRLPTEAEWEKAARGTDGRIYPWGDEFDVNKANCNEIEIELTSAVGCFNEGKSPYGCYDMVGNIWEWCATTMDKPFPYHLEDEWTEAYLIGQDDRVLRGGSCLDGINQIRCDYRSYFDSNENLSNTGFRCFYLPVFGSFDRK